MNSFDCPAYCDVCGQEVEAYCVCPECDVCGEAGNPQCYLDSDNGHLMKYTQEQLDYRTNLGCVNEI